MDLNQAASENNQNREHIILQEELQLALIHTRERIASLGSVADLVLSKGGEAEQLLEKFHTLLKELTDDKDSIDWLLSIREYSASGLWRAKNLIIHNGQRGRQLEKLANQLLSFEHVPNIDVDQIELRSKIGKKIKANWVGMFTKENGHIAKFTKPNGTWGFVCECGCVIMNDLQDHIHGESYFGNINFYGTLQDWRNVPLEGDDRWIEENITAQFERTVLLHDATCGRKVCLPLSFERYYKHYPLHTLGAYLVYERDVSGNRYVTLRLCFGSDTGSKSPVFRIQQRFYEDFSYHPDYSPKEVGHNYFALFDQKTGFWRLFCFDEFLFEGGNYLGFPTKKLNEIPGADGTTGLFQTDKGVFSDPRSSRSFIETASVTAVKDIHNKTTDIYRTAEHELIWNNKETRELKKIVTLSKDETVWVDYPWVTCLNKGGVVQFINLEDGSNCESYLWDVKNVEYMRAGEMPALAMNYTTPEKESIIYIVDPSSSSIKFTLLGEPSDRCLRGPHIKTDPSTSIEVEFLEPKNSFFRKKELPALRLAYTNVTQEVELLSRFFKRSELHATGFAKPGTQAFEDFLKETYAFPEAGLVFYRDISGSRHFVYKDKQEEVARFPLTFIYFTKVFVKGSDGLYRACVRTEYTNVHNYILTYDPETGTLISQDVFRIIETKGGDYLALLGDMVIHKCTILNSQLEAVGELSDAVAERIDFAEKVVDNYGQKIDAFVDGIATFTDRKTKKPVYISKKGEVVFEY